MEPIEKPENKAEKPQVPLLLGGFVKINPIFHERNFIFDHKLVFVLMPFAEPWSDRIWEKLRAVILAKNLRPQRADNRFGAIITEDIWMGIMEAGLIICDTTGWNPNVFYELGIAHTLGKHVILLTQPTHRLPFDTQGFRHFIYTDNPDGMRKIETELPQWIDYCLALKPNVERLPDLEDTPHNRRQKKAIDKQAIQEAKKQREAVKEARRQAKREERVKMREGWLVNSKGYDPELPPSTYDNLRSRLGMVKIRMMQIAYALPEATITQFVEDLKKVWPQKWEELTVEEATKKVVEIEEIVNSRRANYEKDH
jgi:hypothetical protein